MSGTANNSVLANRTIQYDLSGVHDPSVQATTGAPGSTYRKLSIPPKFFIKLDEGKTVNWIDLSGFATGTNLGAGAQVLKNVIAGNFQFRTLVAGAGIQINQLVNTVEIVNTNAGLLVKFTDTIPAMSAKVVDTALLSSFDTLDYTMSFKDSVTNQAKNLKMNVLKDDTNISDSVYSRLGTLKVKADVNISGLNLEMNITNDESNDVLLTAVKIII